MSDLKFVNCRAETTVTVPAWSLVFLLLKADTADDGPSGGLDEPGNESGCSVPRGCVKPPVRG